MNLNMVLWLSLMNRKLNSFTNSDQLLELVRSDFEGTLAYLLLLFDSMPVILVMTQDSNYNKVRSALEQVTARKGESIQ